MKGLGVIVVIGAALFALASPAAARDPRLEHLALNKADMRRASGALLRQSELSGVRSGWRPLATVPDSDQLVCPWQNYSRYTPTGHGEADFQPTKIGNAGFVGSRVDVLATTRMLSANSRSIPTRVPSRARLKRSGRRSARS